MPIRYGAWRGGPDPLEPPYDVAAAVDELGDAVLAGESPRDALAQLLRRGPATGRRGLDELRRAARKRSRQLRRSGQLDGTLQQVRELLDRALEAERAALFPDPSDSARLAEAELNALPQDTAGAVRELSDYRWRAPEAAAAYEEIRDLLRREVLDTQFRGMKQALDGADPEQLARVRDMLADLNTMLEDDARGQHTQEQFERFMSEYGEFFPDNPGDLDELVDSLARRAAAASRLLESLTDEQRAELSELMAGALGDLGIEAEMARLGDSLRQRRPDLPWQRGESMTGDRALGMSDATTALEELAELADLENALGQGYPGASLDDIDRDAVERALGRGAVADVEALRELERQLREQGYLEQAGGELRLTPKAVRRIGSAALTKVFQSLSARGTGQHDVHDAGAAGEWTGGSRAWQYGDEQPIDVVRTVTNAVRRHPAGHPDRGAAIALTVDDFEVFETERRTSAAVSLLVDLSYSMVLRGTWAAAKSTALALHALITTRYPQDALQIVGFSDYARELSATELAGLSWDMVQGTNLQHGLMLASRHLRRHSDSEQIVLVVTDGEPTAHLLADGRSAFEWPPVPETVNATMAEVLRLTRRGAVINVFMLDDDPRLVRFVDQLAQMNGGRVFAASADRLGDYVVSDYLSARRGRGRR
ncbi:MAG: hypothetical protein ABI912_03175 [Actinomycetota bacterium]